MTDVATACCVDLCKAATFSPKTTAEGPRLRLLALDLASDLNSRLLDPSKPFTNSEGVVEILLMSEALAALCKLDRHFVDTTLLEKCLSRNSFPPFQIAFIQACQKLASDPELTSTKSDGTADDDPDDMSNWNVKLKELYPVVASSLRHVFMSAVIELNQFHILMRSNSKVMAGQDNTQKIELVRALLNLWTQDCKLAFYVPPGRTLAPQSGRSCHELNSRLASGAEINPDDLKIFVYLTTLLLNNRNPRPVRQAAMTVLHAYHQPSNSRSTATSDSSRSQIGPSLDLPLGLKQTRAIIGNAILKSLLDSWVYCEEEREVLQLLKAYLDRFKEAVDWSERSHIQTFPFSCESNANDWHVFGHLLQLAIPLGLCTVDQYNLALLLRCSKEIISIFEKHPFVLQLCGLDSSLTASQLTATLQGLPDNGKGLGGRVTQAKRAKLALRRWKLLSTLVGHRPFEDSSGDTVLYDSPPALGAISGEGVLENTNAWISISGLLTSIASLHDPNNLKPRSPPLEHYIPTDLLHDRFYAIPDRAQNVDRYIQEMVDLLVADDLRMREGVKDALGTELNTALFPILLKHLKSIVAHFFENDRVKPQSPFSHFIEQAISMLRLFFERISEPLSELTSERVCSLLIDFTRYTNRLGNLGSEFQAIATRIKYKMAQLCELIVAHKDRIPLITNPVVKNQMIDYFLAWATNVNMVSCISAEEASRQRANRDLSLACLKALSAFYDGLKLQARHYLLRQGPNPNLVHIRLFSRHYDYLTFMLTEVTKLEAVAVRSRKLEVAYRGSTTGAELDHAGDCAAVRLP
ncbi:Ras GTPase activating protein ira2 [Puccinia graminis f. sp. tritici]|uniref:Ras GTPase activating protein ira2 n=1 Tax=Puccinia graminis f. sp. tritici TaxID=56615 RepID=A0A5B0SEV9_PUCGR|nr:Ras GTPase activating protein ira2 [Puccinia graminis f. sp. tritici]